MRKASVVLSIIGLVLTLSIDSSACYLLSLACVESDACVVIAEDLADCRSMCESAPPPESCCSVPEEEPKEKDCSQCVLICSPQTLMAVETRTQNFSTIPIFTNRLEINQSQYDDSPPVNSKTHIGVHPTISTTVLRC